MNKIVALILLILFPFSSVASAAEQVFFYHTDPVGTPLAMTNASGQVVWRADYKPFGEENTVTTNPKNNKEFVGKEKDEETGLYYFNARYLDPAVARFGAVEPIRVIDPYSSKTREEMLLNPQALNLYAYSMNNPYRYMDPDGTYALLTAMYAIGFGILTIITAKVIQDSNVILKNGSSQDKSDTAVSTGAGGASHNWQDDDGNNKKPKKEDRNRKKPGKLGQFKGSDSLKAENDVPEYAVKKYRLNDRQAEQLHREISGQDYSKKTILDIAKNISKGR